MTKIQEEKHKIHKSYKIHGMKSINLIKFVEFGRYYYFLQRSLSSLNLNKASI